MLSRFYLILTCLNFITTKNLNCVFEDGIFNNQKYYKCKLTYKSEFSVMHKLNQIDSDVKYVSNYSSLNFTNFACKKFKNVQIIDIRNIQNIQENSLSDCKSLEIFKLSDSKIKTLPKNLFANQTKLKKLWLDKNQLVKLPDEIFTQLIYLEMLFLNNNRLKTLDSALFGHHSNLWYFNFKSNQLDSVDEKIIAFNMPALIMIDASHNPCVNRRAFVISDSEDRSEIRDVLKRCFANYNNGIRINQLADDFLFIQ